MKTKLSVSARRRLERARRDGRPVEQRIEELRQRNVARITALFTPPGKAASSRDVTRMRAMLAAMGLPHVLELGARRRPA